MMALLLKGHSFPDPDDHYGQFVRFCNGYAFEVKSFYQEMPEGIPYLGPCHIYLPVPILVFGRGKEKP